MIVDDSLLSSSLYMYHLDNGTVVPSVLYDVLIKLNILCCKLHNKSRG